MSHMDDKETETDVSPTSKERSVWHSMRNGLRGRCPRCNSGKIFGKYLKIKDSCSHCGQEFHHHRADDFPPYITITIVGHIILSSATSVQIIYGPPMWVHMLLWLPLILILSLAMLPPVKAALVGIQWAHYMHGFETEDHSPKWDDPN